jgi:molecular chaperone DnaK
LSEASSALAQKMYADQSEGGASPGAESDSGTSDDDAVDAEFEEVSDEDKKENES